MDRDKISGPSALLFSISLTGVIVFAGLRPTIFATIVGWLLIGLTAISTGVLAWSLRDEEFGWRASFAIVGALAAALLLLIFVPLWLFFVYLPTIQGPVLWTF